MPIDLVGWFESQAAATYTAVAAISTGEDAYTVSGDGIWVKTHAPNIVGMAAVADTDLGLAWEFRQNSIKVPYSGMSGGAVTATVDRDTWVEDFRSNPLPIVPNEYLNFYVRKTTNEANYGLAWLGQPWTPFVGNVGARRFRIKADGSTTLTADVWNNVTMTPDTALPAGRYAVVGLWATSHAPTIASNPIACRLKFKDSIFRPGVLCDRGGEDSGKWASVRNTSWYNLWPLTQAYSFRHDDLPTFQYLSSSVDTEESAVLDLVQLSGTPNL